MSRAEHPNRHQATLEEIAITDPRVKNASQLIERRFLDEMEKDGNFGR